MGCCSPLPQRDLADVVEQVLPALERVAASLLRRGITPDAVHTSEAVTLLRHALEQNE